MAITKPERDSSFASSRPIVRLGMFLISHSLFVCILSFMAGVLGLLLLPVLAKNAQVSENALMPGSASSMLSNQEISKANRLVKDINSLNLVPEHAGKKIRRIIANYILDLSAESYHHRFEPHANQLHHRFQMVPDNATGSLYGINSIGIFRAPRGDGKEAIVLVTPYAFGRNGLDESLSLSISFAAFSLLTQVTWLAKDVIWLIADSHHGEFSAVSAWLRDYHKPIFTKLVPPVSEDGFSTRRAGTLAAALVVKVDGKDKKLVDTINIEAEASNGQMPNLDLINVVNYIAAHRYGFHVSIAKFKAFLDSKCLHVLGKIFESLVRVIRSLSSKLMFNISLDDYIEGSAMLASSLYSQALGIPTGSHGAFRDFQVDAITLHIFPGGSLSKKATRNEFLLRGGRLIEDVVRSLNNLLEKFHQSLFLYLLVSPTKFVSVGVYTIPFALLVAPLPLAAASLYLDAIQQTSVKPAPSSGSWEWLSGAKHVCVVHIWGVLVSLLPFFISQAPDSSPTACLLILFSLSMIFLHAALSPLSRAKWQILKSITVSTLFICLILMSIINFSLAQIGALLIVPFSLMVCPFRGTSVRVTKWGASLIAAANLLLGFIAFPPAAFFLFQGVFEGFCNAGAGDFWRWMLSLWAWNSATYVYIAFIHLPCWVLCVWILFCSS